METLYKVSQCLLAIRYRSSLSTFFKRLYWLIFKENFALLFIVCNKAVFLNAILHLSSNLIRKAGLNLTLLERQLLQNEQKTLLRKK